jgi:hypothetical protein
MPLTPLPFRLAGLLLLAGLTLASTAQAADLPRALRTWRAGDLVYLATFDGHLQTWDVSDSALPQLLSDRDVGGPVVDLHIEARRVTAIVVRPRPVLFTVDEHGRLGGAQASGLAADVTSTERGIDRVEIGRVSEVRGSEVLLKLDQAGQVHAGEFVRIRSRSKDLRVDPSIGGEFVTSVSDADVLLEVTHVDGDLAAAELGRGQAAEPGDEVLRASQEPDILKFLLPPRLPHELWARVLIRPILNLDSTTGSGVLAEMEVGKVFGNWQVSLHARPLSLSNESMGPVHAYGMLTYQRDYFAMGLGTGAFRRPDWSCWFEEDLCRKQVLSATLVQFARLGSADGLHVKATIAESIERHGPEPALADLALVVPVARYADALIQGGGGDGVTWLEIGTRLFLQGVGGADTAILTLAVGISQFDVLKASFAEIDGPHVTVGLETRM